MRVIDGPIGSYLIARGVLPHRVWRAALDVPDLVVAAHRAYLDAGAADILTNTFALPAMVARENLSEMAVAECIDTALELAFKALQPQHQANIHVNLGPTGTDDATLAQSVMNRVLTCAGARIKHGRAVSVWFETLNERDAAWLAPVLPKNTPYTLSFTLTDTPPPNLAQFAEGAWACGCNCSSFDPKDTARMQRALHAWSLAPLPAGVKRLAKPSLTGTGGAVLPHAQRLGFDLVGACCGGSVSDIARLAGVEVLQ